MERPHQWSFPAFQTERAGKSTSRGWFFPVKPSCIYIEYMSNCYYPMIFAVKTPFINRSSMIFPDFLTSFPCSKRHKKAISAKHAIKNAQAEIAAVENASPRLSGINPHHLGDSVIWIINGWMVHNYVIEWIIIMIYGAIRIINHINMWEIKNGNQTTNQLY